MSRLLINIDAQDAQDYLARGYTVLSSTIAYTSTGIPKTRSQAHGSLRTRTRSSSQSASPAAASRPVYPVYRCSQIQPTGLTDMWSLFPTGHEGSLFHPRMIRPPGRGPDLFETNLFPSRMIRTAGRGTARGQTGVSHRVHVGFPRSRPPDTPHHTAGTAFPGSAGVPPASCPFGRR